MDFLGILSAIAEIISAGGESAANDSNCSDSDRRLGNEIKESGQNFADTLNKFRNRMNDYDDYDD